MNPILDVHTLRTPGSQPARLDGCCCSVIDNGQGTRPQGHDSAGNPVWVVAVDCPLHIGGDR